MPAIETENQASKPVPETGHPKVGGKPSSQAILSGT